jgi:hypothetical protein
MLMHALDDPHAAVRARAAEALGDFAHAAEPGLTVLLRRLSDEQRCVAIAAANAILRIAPESSSAIDAALSKRADLGLK